MKMWIKESAWLLAVAGLVSGCASTGGMTAPVAEGNPDNAVAPATAEMRYLNVSVASSSLNKDGKLVASRLERAVRDKLAANGLPMRSAAPDILLSMAVDAKSFDQSGEYHVYRVRVQATAQTTAAPVKDLGMKTLEIKSDRKLGKDEALLNAADKLSNDAVAWSVSMVDPSRSELLANDLTVEAPWYKTRRGQADYARNFVKEVSGLAGVVNCRLVSHDYANKIMVYRVVYMRDAYPAGVLNYLATKNKLNIKPKK
jgi:type IV pilus biogenesis protein CpaD/CtpE